MGEDLKGWHRGPKEDDPPVDSGDKAVSKLHEGLDLLDAAIHVPLPSAAWFDQHIAVTKSKQRSKLLRDLLMLWIGALLLFYVYYLTVTARPIAFISIQAAAILIPLAWLLFRRQVASHEND